MAEIKLTITAEDGTVKTFKAIEESAKTAFDKIKNNAESSSAATATAFDKIKTSWGNLKSAWAELLAVYAAGSFLLNAMKDAYAAEVAFNKLKIQVEGLGLAYSSVAGPIQAAINRTSEYARVQDEEVAKSLQQMIFLTGDLAGSMNNLNLVYDLAYQKGISQEEAANLVSKAMTGNVEMLGRYIPELRNLDKALGLNASEAEKTAYAMALLTEKTQGALDKATEHEKQLQEMTKTYKDAYEGLGKLGMGFLSSVALFGKALGEMSGHVSLMITEGPDAAMNMAKAMYSLEAADKAAAKAALESGAAHEQKSKQIAAAAKEANDARAYKTIVGPAISADELNDMKQQGALVLQQLEIQHGQGLISTEKYYTQRQAVLRANYDKEWDIQSEQYDRTEALMAAEKDPAKKLALEAKLIEENTALKTISYTYDKDSLILSDNKLKNLQAEADLYRHMAQEQKSVAMDIEDIQIKMMDDPFARQTAQMELNYKRQTEATYNHIAELYAAQEKDGKDRSDLIASYGEKQKALEEQYAHDQIALDRQIAIEKVDATSTALGSIAQLMMTGNKKQFEEGKRMALAQAYINAASAIVKIWSTAANWYIGLVQTVAVAASTATQINRIQSQQYATGGQIPLDMGQAGKDSVPILAMPGEFVLRKEAVDYYGLNNVTDINEFRKHKFALGGKVSGYGFGGSIDWSDPIGSNKEFNQQVLSGNASKSWDELLGLESMRNKENDAIKKTVEALIGSVEYRYRELTMTEDAFRLDNLKLVQADEMAKAQAEGIDTTKLAIVQTMEYNKAIEEIAQAHKSFTDDIQIRMMQATGNTAGAELLRLQISQANELAEAQSKGYDTTELLKVQTLEYADAVKKASATISETYQKLIDTAKKAVTDMISIQSQALNTIKTILSGKLGGLSPEAAYIQAQTAFAGASPENLSEASTNLLDASRAYNASGMQYQRDLKMVLDKLGTVGGIGTNPTLTAANSQLNLLDKISTAISDGNTEIVETLKSNLGVDSVLAKLISTWNDSTKAALDAAKADAQAVVDAAASAERDAIIAANAEYRRIQDERERQILAQNAADAAAAQAAADAAAQAANGVAAMYRQIITEGEPTTAEGQAAERAAHEAYEAQTYYDVGSPFLGSDQLAQVHRGEAIIDARSNEVLRKYGIKVQASSGNNDAVIAKMSEQIAELREQNKHLAAAVNLLQAGFTKTIELGEDQKNNFAALVNKARLASAA